MIAIIIYFIGLLLAYVCIGITNDKTSIMKWGIVWVLLSWCVVLIFLMDYVFSNIDNWSFGTPSLKKLKSLFKNKKP